MKHAPSMPPQDALLCEQVHMSYGPVQALQGADLRVRWGRIVGLLGENGAGKSTLMRLIAGELTPDAGHVSVAGSVGLVRQQLSIVPELTVLENIAFGAEHARGRRSLPNRLLGRIDWKELGERASAFAQRTGLEVPLHRRAGELPAGVQQRVEMLGALLRGSEVLLLDEPTSYLTPHEVDNMFAVIRKLAEEGLSAVFITHKLREVADHCDEVSVLRKGRTVAHFACKPFDLSAIGRSMTDDDDLSNLSSAPRTKYAAQRHAPAPAALLSAAGGTLQLAAGEIVGIAGVAGNGQDELFATLAGLRRDRRYMPVLLSGEQISTLGTWERRRRGLRLIPSEVKAAGVVAEASLTENVLTAMVPGELRRRFGFVRRAAAEAQTEKLISQAGIVARGPRQLAGELSGGNQQRLMVARELRGAASVVIAHEPTRGVDFAAAAAIDERLTDFAAGGGAVLLLTSDLDELLALSDRVHVLRDGRLSPPLERRDVSLGRLGELLGGLQATDLAGELELAASL